MSIEGLVTYTMVAVAVALGPLLAAIQVSI